MNVLSIVLKVLYVESALPIDPVFKIFIRFFIFPLFYSKSVPIPLILKWMCLILMVFWISTLLSPPFGSLKVFSFVIKTLRFLSRVSIDELIQTRVQKNLVKAFLSLLREGPAKTNLIEEYSIFDMDLKWTWGT